jgi:flagellar motor switch protein FliN/FliY
MADQNPDIPDPDAAEEPQSDASEPTPDAAPRESDADAPESAGAKPADAAPEASGESEIDDMAAAALEAAKSAINDLNSETEGASTSPDDADSGGGEQLDQQLVEQMMADLENEPQQEGDSAAGGGGRTIGTPSPRGGDPEHVDLPDLEAGANGHAPEGIELLSDVDLQVKIELGRTVMLVEDVLRLNNGSIVELDKLAGDPVDVYVNDRRVARGEVLVLNDAFCVRISEVLAPVKAMGKP